MEKAELVEGRTGFGGLFYLASRRRRRRRVEGQTGLSVYLTGRRRRQSGQKGDLVLVACYTWRVDGEGRGGGRANWFWFLDAVGR
jgi:hypothetical protein